MAATVIIEIRASAARHQAAGLYRSPRADLNRILRGFRLARRTPRGSGLTSAVSLMYTRSPHLSSGQGVRRMSLWKTVQRYAIVGVAAHHACEWSHSSSAASGCHTARGGSRHASCRLRLAVASSKLSRRRPKPNETQAEEFARLVKEWTTGPEFISPLVDHLPIVAGRPHAQRRARPPRRRAEDPDPHRRSAEVLPRARSGDAARQGAQHRHDR